MKLLSAGDFFSLSTPPNLRPILVGPGKCARKGHRPIPKAVTRDGIGKTIEDTHGNSFDVQVALCKRCESGWDYGFHDRQKASKA